MLWIAERFFLYFSWKAEGFDMLGPFESKSEGWWVSDGVAAVVSVSQSCGAQWRRFQLLLRTRQSRGNEA